MLKFSYFILKIHPANTFIRKLVNIQLYLLLFAFVFWDMVLYCVAHISSELSM